MVDLVLCRSGLNRNAESHWSSVPPLGLGYLAAATRLAGISTGVVDGKMEGHQTAQQTINSILKLKPGVLGLSLLTPEYNLAKAIAEGVKSSQPNLCTIVGGAHVNALPQESLRDCEHFDTAIAGEAEATLPGLTKALLDGSDLSELEGVIYRNGTGKVVTSLRPLASLNLANLPLPAWDMFPKSSVYPVLTERGCPFSCVFCSRNLDSQVRRRSIESVIDEVSWLKRDFSPGWIYFEDETFGLNKERTMELLEKLLKLNTKGSLRFKAQTRIDCIDFEVLKLMKRVGFEYLEFGVESGDPDVLKSSGKGILLDQVEPAVKLARSAGIKSWLKFIIGLPGESCESVRRTIDFAVKLNPERLSVAIIVAYPGSQIYKWAQNNSNGYRLLSDDWDTYDKYIGSGVELDSLSSKMMKRYQVQIYLEMFGRNGRYLELIRFLWQNRAFVKPTLATLLKRSTGK